MWAKSLSAVDDTRFYMGGRANHAYVDSAAIGAVSEAAGSSTLGAMHDELSPGHAAHIEEDAALMLRYQAGDAGAFDALYAKHRGGLFRFIARQSLSQTESEEVFQDVWVNVIESRMRYVPTAQFRTWLFTIAHHRTMDFFRKHNRVRELVTQQDDAAVQSLPANRVGEPEVQTASRQQGHAIRQALEALPTAQRETFLMYEEGGLSVEEIAEATGVSFEAAKSRLRYAVARLRASLKDFA
jgi:RNA polymerase sigma factor (sigma-70 family)